MCFADIDRMGFVVYNATEATNASVLGVTSGFICALFLSVIVIIDITTIRQSYKRLSLRLRGN